MPWGPTLIDSEILAVHAGFLNYVKILFFGGNQHDGKFSAAGRIDAMRLFDCRTISVSQVSALPRCSLIAQSIITGFINKRYEAMRH